MTPERWQCIREIFNAAIELPQAEGDAFLGRACGGDDDLFNEVRYMVEEHRRSGLLDRPPIKLGFAASATVFQVGQVVVDRYFIVRYVGRGGMGEVYEARDPELGVTVALKTVLSEIANEEPIIARFKREIALSREVAHPNVCKVFDIARHKAEDGREIVFLTMEFLAGETLSAKLDRDGAMKESEALPLLEQMAAALDASHAAGVIHRDFKPSNVMLVPSAGGVRPVITDFGLARKFVAADDSTATLSRNLMGTPGYMAPELLTGAPATFASDVYALGITAYQMVTGGLPFSSDWPLRAAVARVRQPIPSPTVSTRNLDPRWERAILRALDPKPGNRFYPAAQFVAALRGDTGSTAARLLAPFRYLAQTRTRVGFAGAAIVAASVALVGWGEWERARHRLPEEAEVLYRDGVGDIAAGAYFAADKALEEAVKVAPHAPQVRARLAEALLELDSPERAAEQMLQAKREDLSWVSKTDALRIEAIDLAITHEYAAAAAKYAQVVREAGDSAEIEVDLGRAYNNAGKPDDAMRAFRRAAEGPEHSAAAWLRLGMLYGVQRKKKQSDDAFAEADRLYQLTSNLEGIGETALQRGIAATARGELDAGARYLQSALEIAQHAGNWQQEITATLRLSTNAFLAGRTDAAEHYALDGLEMARRHNLDALAIRGLVSLGSAFRLRQNYAGAEQRYRQALDLAGNIHEPHLVAYAHLSLAGLYWDMKRRDQAAAEARQALSFYRPNHYAKEALQSETVIARFQRDTGDYDGALASLRSLLQTAESLHDSQSMALAHGDLGNLLFDRDNFPQALEHYRKSLELAADAQQAAYAAMQCGNTLWRLGQYAESAAMFEKADAAAGKFPPLYLQLLYGRAAMFLSQDRYKEAAEKARSALAAHVVRAAEFDADVYEVLGLSLVRGGNAQAGLAFCERAWNATSSDSDVSEKIEAAIAVVEARIAAGKRDAAREIYRQVEADLGKFPESQWRFFAALGSFDPAFGGRARDALAQLSRAWGEPVYNAYLTRPDVSRLTRHLLRPVSALP